MSTPLFDYAACVKRFQAGEPPSQIVKTVRGDPVRLLEINACGDYPITGRIGDRSETWNAQGRCHRESSNDDLRMCPPSTVKREGWFLLDELDAAFRNGYCPRIYTTQPDRPSLRIEWETEVV